MAYAYYMKGKKEKMLEYLTKIEGCGKLEQESKYLMELVRIKTGNFEQVERGVGRG